MNGNQYENIDLNEVAERLKRISTQGVYTNSKTFDIGGIPFSATDVIVRAPLIAGTNVYLIGGTGEGKTQLAHDLAGIFGDSYCYIIGRPDFEISEVFKTVDLSGLRDPNASPELVKLVTEKMRKTLFFADEINRCPPVIQNYFLDFADGKYVDGGRIYELGNKGYSIMYATANVGNGDFVGTEDSDRALKDRMHMIIKLDDPGARTTDEDNFKIFSGKKSPRTAMPDQQHGDSLEDIFFLHEEHKKIERPIILPIIASYFHRGLDYLENTERHSKAAVANTWPNCTGIRPDTDESLIMPFSKRSLLSAMTLTEVLELMATVRKNDDDERYKNVEIDTLSIFLDVLKLTAPFSGVINQQYILDAHGGDTYSAFDKIMESIREDIGRKKEALYTVTSLAYYGIKGQINILNEISPEGREGRWSPVRRTIENISKKQEGEPEEVERLTELLRER